MKIYESLEDKKSSCLDALILCELMAGYAYVQRPDKINKIKSELNKTLEAKELGVSLIKLKSELLSL
jgi:hypothetical protein